MGTATQRSKEHDRFRFLKTLFDPQAWQQMMEDNVLHMLWNLDDPEESEFLDRISEFDDVDDEPLTTEQMEEVERPLLEVLELDTDWAPEELAPPVDEQRMIALFQGELSGEQQDELFHLMARFQSWFTAGQRVHRRLSDRREANRRGGFDDGWSNEELNLDWPFNEQSGIKKRYLPDELAPPVDEGRLIALVRHELPLKESRELMHRIVTFKSWLDGLEHVVRDRLDRNPSY